MAAALKILYLVQNDTGRKIRFTWTGQDLTGWSANVHVGQVDGTVFTKAGVLVSGGPPGIFDFSFSAGELQSDDNLRRPIEFELTDTGGTGEVTTFPSQPSTLFVVVRDELA